MSWLILSLSLYLLPEKWRYALCAAANAVVWVARILANVRRNYPHLTLISITQKLAPVQDYDQIILLMEGEVLAAGTHEELARSSPEYGQILRSQQSTDAYEAA